MVLPPGDWDKKNLLSMSEISEMRQRRKNRQGKGTESPKVPRAKEDEAPCRDQPEDKRNPLSRIRVPFGGLIDDIKNRYPLFVSDLKDGLNPQCLAATIFIYFAALSGAVAFGGLMGELQWVQSENLKQVSSYHKSNHSEGDSGIIVARLDVES